MIAGGMVDRRSGLERFSALLGVIDFGGDSRWLGAQADAADSLELPVAAPDGSIRLAGARCAASRLPSRRRRKMVCLAGHAPAPRFSLSPLGPFPGDGFISSRVDVCRRSSPALPTFSGAGSLWRFAEAGFALSFIGGLVGCSTGAGGCSMPFTPLGFVVLADAGRRLLAADVDRASHRAAGLGMPGLSPWLLASRAYRGSCRSQAILCPRAAWPG